MALCRSTTQLHVHPGLPGCRTVLVRCVPLIFCLCICCSLVLSSPRHVVQQNMNVPLAVQFMTGQMIWCKELLLDGMAHSA